MWRMLKGDNRLLSELHHPCPDNAGLRLSLVVSVRLFISPSFLLMDKYTLSFTEFSWHDCSVSGVTPSSDVCAPPVGSWASEAPSLRTRGRRPRPAPGRVPSAQAVPGLPGSGAGTSPSCLPLPCINRLPYVTLKHTPQKKAIRERMRKNNVVCIKNWDEGINNNFSIYIQSVLGSCLC